MKDEGEGEMKKFETQFLIPNLGTFYYEVKVLTDGLFQIGWTTNEITGDNDVRKEKEVL